MKPFIPSLRISLHCSVATDAATNFLVSESSSNP